MRKKKRGGKDRRFGFFCGMVEKLLQDVLSSLNWSSSQTISCQEVSCVVGKALIILYVNGLQTRKYVQWRGLIFFQELILHRDGLNSHIGHTIHKSILHKLDQWLWNIWTCSLETETYASRLIPCLFSWVDFVIVIFTSFSMFNAYEFITLVLSPSIVKVTIIQFKNDPVVVECWIKFFVINLCI